MSNLLKVSGCFIFLALLMSGCREPSSGCCKDSFATNFDAMAEENTCCEYPTLNFSINHVLEVIPDSFLFINELNNGMIINGQSTADSFVVTQSAWFFRAVELSQDMNWTRMEELTIIPLKDSVNLDHLKNYTVQDFISFRVNEVGNTNLIGTMDGVRFTMGWQDLELDTSSSRIVLNSTMTRLKNIELISPSGGIYLGQIKLLRRVDSVEFVIPIEADRDMLFQFSPIDFVRGKDRRIVFYLEYNALLNGLDINGEVEAMKTTILNNIDNGVLKLDTIF